MKTLIAFAILFGWIVASRGTSVIVPNSLRFVEGNAANAFPFSQPSGTSMRYQQVFAASQFMTAIPSGGTITQIWFRGDATADTYGIIDSLQLNLSTTPKAPDGLSTTFAQNVGGNDTVVFGPHIISLAPAGAGVPQPFSARIPLSQPFFYDPNQGNLLLDVRNYSGGFTFEFDAENTAGDSVSRVYAFGVSSASGIADSFGLVARFDITPVPEPSTLALAFMGALLLFGKALFPKRRTNQHKGTTWQQE